jgi:hypothetical protein
MIQVSGVYIIYTSINSNVPNRSAHYINNGYSLLFIAVDDDVVLKRIWIGRYIYLLDLLYLILK